MDFNAQRFNSGNCLRDVVTWRAICEWFDGELDHDFF